MEHEVSWIRWYPGGPGTDGIGFVFYLPSAWSSVESLTSSYFIVFPFGEWP